MSQHPSLSASSEAASLLATFLDEPIVIADVGCRWGFADAWEQLGDRCHIIGFEPDEDECERLRKRYQGRPGVEIVGKALGPQAGTATLYITNDPACSSLYPPLDDVVDRHPRLEIQRLADRQQIALTTLDSWCEQRAVERVDLIKLDTQGSELDVLRGAARTLERVLMVQTEVEFNRMYEGQPLFGDIDRFLRDRGFVLWQLENLAHHRQRGARSVLRRSAEFFDWDVAQFSRRSGQLFWADALFVRADVTRPNRATPLQEVLRHACLTAALGMDDLTGLILEYRRRDVGGNAREAVEAVCGLLPEPEHETEWLTALEGIDTREGSQLNELGVDGTLHRDLVIDFGEAIDGAGWREPHRFDSKLGRWTGPGRQAWIDIPFRLPPTTRVELVIAVASTAQECRPIEVTLNGIALDFEYTAHGCGGLLLSGRLPADYESGRLFTRISIRAAEPRPRDGTDPRKTGLGVTELRLLPPTGG
jgi:FkbM family methyltransferase